MEKFFVVSDKSGLYYAYNKYLDNIPVLNEQVKEFMKNWEMETDKYACTSNRFYIIPTKNDMENFKTQLMSKCEEDGKFWGFKKSSIVGKSWINMGAEVIDRPWVGMYFKECLGRTSSRLFKINGIIYCSFKNEFDVMDTPEGFVEIKGSVFYKIMEEHDDQFYD